MPPGGAARRADASAPDRGPRPRGSERAGRLVGAAQHAGVHPRRLREHAREARGELDLVRGAAARLADVEEGRELGTCRSRAARRRAFSMATPVWSASTRRRRRSSSVNRSSPMRDRTTTPMTRAFRAQGREEHRLLGQRHRARDVHRARMAVRVVDDDGLARLRDPAGEALADARRAARRGISPSYSAAWGRKATASSVMPSSPST